MRIRDEKKESIVKQKAIALIAHQGLDGFSMQKLAKAAKVSPATLYIYYKDKDDLILKVGTEEGKRMTRATLNNFDPAMDFHTGLKKQWENRARYILEHPLENQLLEQLRHSTHRDKIFAAIRDDFAAAMGQFIHAAIRNGQLVALPVEVFWSVAFAPLYNLLRFHADGHGVSLRPFKFSKKIMYQTLDLVLKALHP